jgi:hypothetical protein
MGMLLCLTTCIAVVLGGGCAPGGSSFTVIDHRPGGESQRFVERFDEAYYDTGADGNVVIVLRTVTPSQIHAGQPITQTVVLRTFWRDIPGKAQDNPTRINATASYAVLVGQSGTAFEGGGSVFCSENDAKDTLTGSLDYAILTPTRTIKDPNPIFANVELSGTFVAYRNSRVVTRLANELDNTFGPVPPSAAAGR